MPGQFCIIFVLGLPQIRQAHHVLDHLGTYCAFSFLYWNIGVIVQTDTYCPDICCQYCIDKYKQGLCPIKSTYCTWRTFPCSVICGYPRHVIVVEKKSILLHITHISGGPKLIVSCVSTFQRNFLRELHKCHDFW